jgi:hypothetical protein
LPSRPIGSGARAARGGHSALSSRDRAWAALASAGVVLFVAMMGMRFLRRFVSRERIESPTTFLCVWVLAFFAWLAWRYW